VACTMRAFANRDPCPCPCQICRHYSRGYVHHLLKAKALLSITACIIHTLAFMNCMMADRCTSIAVDDLLLDGSGQGAMPITLYTPVPTHKAFVYIEYAAWSKKSTDYAVPRSLLFPCLYRSKTIGALFAFLIIRRPCRINCPILCRFCRSVFFRPLKLNFLYASCSSILALSSCGASFRS
jgi:hypothetical protein